MLYFVYYAKIRHTSCAAKLYFSSIELMLKSTKIQSKEIFLNKITITKENLKKSIVKIYLRTKSIGPGFSSTMTPNNPENISQKTTPNIKPTPHSPSQEYG